MQHWEGKLPSKYRVSVNLNAEEYTQLSNIAAQEGLSMAWIGKRAITEFLNEYNSTAENKRIIPRRRSKTIGSKP